MIDQGLCPGVEDGNDPDLCTQVFGILGQYRERPGGGFEQEVVESPLVAERQRPQFQRQSEDHVEVMSGQEVLVPVQKPSFLLQRLAFGAMPVPA